MADQLYGLTGAEVQRLKRLLDAFENGQLNQRPRYRRKPLHWNSAGTASIFSSITSKLDGRDWLNDDAMQQPASFYTHPVDDDGVIGTRSASTDRPYNPSLFPMAGDALNTLYPVLEDAAGLQWFIPLWSQRCINALMWHMAGEVSGSTAIALNGSIVPLPEDNDYILSAHDGGWWEFDHDTDKVSITKKAFYLCIAHAELAGTVSTPPQLGHIRWSDVATAFSTANRGYFTFTTNDLEYHSVVTMTWFAIDDAPVDIWLHASLPTGVDLLKVVALIFPFGFGETP